MRAVAPLVATILLCFTLLSLDQLQSTEARAVHHDRVKRAALTPAESQYLESLYNTFLKVFNEYRRTPQSNQFAVATINLPADLKPCPLVMNDDLGQISPENNNYLAYTPVPSVTRPNGYVHAEQNILNHYNAITAHVNVQSVHLVTHFNPCGRCTNELRALVTQHRNTIFYIGYVERYQNEDSLNYFIANVGNEVNVHFGQISPSIQGCPLQIKGNTCPLKKCTSTTMAYTSMEDLMIEDDIMNAQQQLLYDLEKDFLDQVRASSLEFLHQVIPQPSDEYHSEEDRWYARTAMENPMKAYLPNNLPPRNIAG